MAADCPYSARRPARAIQVTRMPPSGLVAERSTYDALAR
jgi:hypothetical protein